MGHVKLNTICTFKQWPTIPKNELEENGYPVYGANGIIGHSSKYNHEDPTIMICCRGATCGSINVSQEKCYITGNAMCLDNLSQDYDIRFVEFYLRYFDFSKIITGAAQPQITQIALDNVYIPSMSIEKQKAISNALGKIEIAINVAKNQLLLLDELIKSRFIGQEVQVCV